MTPVKPNVERLIGQLIRLRASLPAALSKKVTADARVHDLTKALQGGQLSMSTANNYRTEIGGWTGALEEPARLQRDIEAIEADLRAAAALIAQAVT